MKQAERDKLWQEANKHRREFCEACHNDFHDGKLHLHHITPRRKKNWSKRWNLIILCWQCHIWVHHQGRTWFLNKYPFLKKRFERAKMLNGRLK